MIFRITTNLIMAGCVLLAVICAAPFAKGHGPGNEWIMRNHPRCCGDEDCREVRVRYTPQGYVIFAIVPMPGRAHIELEKPILVPENRWIPSPHREARACFKLRRTGGPPLTRPVRLVAYAVRCFFEPGSGQ